MANQDSQDVQDVQQPDQTQVDVPWFLKAKCPVFLPKHDALTLPADEFEAFLRDSIRADINVEPTQQGDAMIVDVDAEVTGMSVQDDGEGEPQVRENTMRTTNNDVAFRSTKDSLLDLFYELHDDGATPTRLQTLLGQAWDEDRESTLKIIFNARSIHLGKSSRLLFYRCAGWLSTTHPLTLFANLRWLVRPVIPKKAEKTTEEDGVMVETSATLRKLEMADKSTGGETADNLVLDAEYDVQHGVAHGYWKDLVNILALSANDRLNVIASQDDILHVEREKQTRWPDQETARGIRHDKRRTRHETVVDLYTNKPLHRAIHMAVARLFAEQLQSDLAALAGDDKKAKRNISLCAKWAPSTDRFHDRHTFVVSSIAEIMFPESQLVDKGVVLPSTNDDERTIYLRHARDKYRKAVATLRKHLEVVERDVSANTLGNIKYERVPSLAMSQHWKTFTTKDPKRFEAYLDQVASGKSRISGATLLPSEIISRVRKPPGCTTGRPSRGKKRVRDLVDSHIAATDGKVLDGQWNTLVRRIKDSGTMPSCIAVCDVSGSMFGPVFRDGSCPLDSAIGLSLLVAEVAEPPFRGTFITFSEKPALEMIDLSTTVTAKVQAMANSNWGMTTDFEAVFTSLILPMAIQNKLKQEEMVKRIFVFSDMQFNQARAESTWHQRYRYSSDNQAPNPWSTSYERIQKAYQDAGYEVPELVFWNLAGSSGRGNANMTTGNNEGVESKPATVENKGIAMVSGYSQAMLKLFLDKGLFGEEENEVVETVEEDEDGDELVTLEVKKPKLDPLVTVMKAISPQAYAMLKVVD
ncbi:hypothetical protein QBC39DRAFT_343169 [Podospora conica]|nr:hypothetical protein QBC39DRAFT_343169 [Schizothecium conicum]